MKVTLDDQGAILLDAETHEEIAFLNKWRNSNRHQVNFIDDGGCYVRSFDNGDTATGIILVL